MTPAPAHVSRIMAVMEAGFDPAYGEAWTLRQVHDALTLPSTHALVVDSSMELIEPEADIDTAPAPCGFILTRHAADEEELLLIAVVPEERGRGIGSALIERLFTEAKLRGVARIFLEMRRNNPAEHLYRKAGFEPIGTRSQYYRFADGAREDAITFARSI